ncbi:MAG: T9SS type A sorting domain-containing protein, partial [Bacteroidota bacterium]|nr:T9SS type A sorting domain-containing protein [Bacteroidota bacterium]
YTGFQHDGWWFDYMSGDSLYVDNTDMTISLEPGEWKIYTDAKLTLPDLNNPIDTSEIITSTNYSDWEEEVDKFNIYPNPFKDVLNFRFEVGKSSSCNLSLYNHLGELVFNKELIDNQSNVVSYKLNLKENRIPLQSGFYICEIETPSDIYRKKIIYIK